MKNAVNATDTGAQYDEKVKRLLGNKIILAHILVKVIDEFQKMTNTLQENAGQRIVGLTTEYLEINEG